MRRLGYAAVDAIVGRLEALDTAPVVAPAGREEMEARLREPLPEAGCDPHVVLDTALRDVLEPGLRVDHPRFFAFTPMPSNPVGAVGDLLAAGFGVFAGTWLASPGAAMVELVVLDWLRELCGLPPGTEGLFVSGGSAANLTALTIALEERAGSERPRATVYLSDQAHSSVERALRVAGIPPAHVRVLPTDDRQRMVPADLAAAVAADRAAGRLPVCVVATAGTTGTGAVDPLPALRRVCDAEGLWLHVDGAYGAAAMLCPQGRRELDGPRARRLIGARSPQVALPAARARLPARGRRRGARADLRDGTRIPARRRRRRGRGQLRRPRHPADPPVPGAQAVDVAEGLRCGGLPQCRRARPGARRARGEGARPPPRVRGRDARPGWASSPSGPSPRAAPPPRSTSSTPACPP